MSALPPDLEHTFFAPHVGARFDASLAGASFPLTLVSVEVLPGGRAGHRAPFLLLFDAPPGTPVAQGTHVLAQESLGAFEVFLVPAQPGPTGAPRLAATFN